MQIGSALQRASVSRWLTTLLAVVLIATVVTLLAVAGVFASGVGENASPYAGGGFADSVVIHDVPGNVHVHGENANGC